MSLDVDKTETDYTKEKQIIKDKLHHEDWLSTPDIHKNTLAEVKHKKDYWRYQLLPGLLKKMLENEEVQKEERPEGGQWTHYWRLE